ncbi:hypothetical protein CEXT_87381 [Caerostris extrusa]|uniref:Uncharacterized protein n=1 Tax=Caerostris extrusa TaxID=172846 RepID=A0AAV4QR93_CAEEX|nr:hypothetical protein CEXT_87381 [Caerostris extrusa]
MVGLGRDIPSTMVSLGRDKLGYFLNNGQMGGWELIYIEPPSGRYGATLGVVSCVSWWGALRMRPTLKTTGDVGF